MQDNKRYLLFLGSGKPVWFTDLNLKPDAFLVAVVKKIQGERKLANINLFQQRLKREDIKHHTGLLSMSLAILLLFKDLASEISYNYLYRLNRTVTSTKADVRSGAAAFSFKSDERAERRKEASENAVILVLFCLILGIRLCVAYTSVDFIKFSSIQSWSEKCMPRRLR